jgi:hypothetical protein
MIGDKQISNYNQMVVRNVPRFTWLAEKMPGSPIYSFSATEAKGSSKFYVAWDDEHNNLSQARLDFLGYSEGVSIDEAVENFGGKRFVRRIIPYEHPNEPDYLFADAIQKIEGDVPIGSPSKDSSDVAMYDEALFDIQYSSRPFQVLTDKELQDRIRLLPGGGGLYPDESSLLRYVSIQTQGAGKTERIPPNAASLKWVGNPPDPPAARRPMNNSCVVNLVEGQVQITWYQIPVEMVPWRSIFVCLGCTNEDALGPFPAKTLVLQVPKIGVPYRMATGEFAVDVLYNFLWKPFGANAFLRWDAISDDGLTSGPQYQLATRDGTADGKGLFPVRLFNGLFWGPAQIP